MKEASKQPIPCGAFELIEPVGMGGVAEVWRGRHRRQQIPVAIKVLVETSFEPEDSLEIFRREVQAQAGLHHRGITPVYDYGQIDEQTARACEDFVEGTPYIAMEYAEAGTLLDRREDIEWPELKNALLNTLDALAHAHARGVIHRDFKPANLLHFPDQPPEHRWKLTDFGIAHALDRAKQEADDSLISAGAGTIYYMAPEQHHGKWRRFGPWTDLYQLGCSTYQLICGKPPYTGNSAIDVAHSHLTEPVPDLDPEMEVPSEVETWLKRLLEKHPASRFRRAADAAHALEKIGPDEDEGIWERFQQVFTGLTRVFRKNDRHPNESKADYLQFDTDQFPDDWSRNESPLPQPELADVGLGLFGLREIPFVDRDDERDRIWNAFKGVVRDKRPGALMIVAESGTGKSRLSEWTLQRAHETGACIGFQISHGRQGGPREGLRGMLEDWLQSWNLERSDCYELIKKKLKGFARIDDTEYPTSLENDAAALTEFIRPTPEHAEDVDGPAYDFHSKEKQYALVRRLFDRVSQFRPVFVQVDDLQRSRATLDFLDFFFDSDKPCPVFFLITKATESASDTGLEASMVTLLEYEHVDYFTLDPLEERDEKVLVEQLLPLEQSVAELIHNQTEGHPLFAVQLVRDLVVQDLLEPTPDGFTLKTDVSKALPENLRRLWIRRLAQTVEYISAPPDQLWKLLEIAAALGQDVSQKEWEAVAEHLGIEPLGAIPNELMERGLAKRTGSGWRFTHQSLVDRLQERAKENNDAETIHRACAEVLEQMYPNEREVTAETRADHLLKAGRPTEALGPLATAVEYVGGVRGDYDKQRKLLEDTKQILRDCDIPKTDPRHYETEFAEAHNLTKQGELERADEVAKKLQNRAMDDSDEIIKARAIKRRAIVAHNQGQFDRALGLLEAAEPVFRTRNEKIELTDCLGLRGRIHLRKHEYDDAFEYLEQARDYASQLDRPMKALACDNALARLFLEKQEYERAKTIAEGLAERAQQLKARYRQGSAINMLGDIARTNDAPEQALKHYTHARELWRMSGSKGTISVSINIGITHEQLGNWEQAKKTFNEVRESVRKRGLDVYLPFIQLGRMAYHAHQQAWDRWDDIFEKVQTKLDETDFRAAEHAQLARINADQCIEHGQYRRAGSMLRVEKQVWTRMDRQDKVREVNDQLETIET